MSTAARERRKVSPSSSEKEAGSVPSGFVLKLFQMVNGASDEVVSVSAPALRLASDVCRHFLRFVLCWGFYT